MAIYRASVASNIPEYSNPGFGGRLSYDWFGAQLGNFKHGIGTKYPFRFLTFKDKTAIELKTALEELNLKGLSFKIMDTKQSSGEAYRVYISL